MSNDAVHTPVQPLKRILLVGLVNSGTTAIAKCFLQRRDTDVLSQVLKTSVEREGHIDFKEFYNYLCDKNVLFNKETLGSESISRCTFPLFQDIHLLDEANYFFFIFRHPVAIWESWMKRGLETNQEYLVAAYKHLFDSFLYVRDSAQAEKILFAEMANGVQPILSGMCDFCGIDFDETMLTWTKQWGNRRGGIRGNPDIDSYSTFSKERIRKALLISSESDVDGYIMRNLESIWNQFFRGECHGSSHLMCR